MNQENFACMILAFAFGLVFGVVAASWTPDEPRGGPPERPRKAARRPAPKRTSKRRVRKGS